MPTYVLTLWEESLAPWSDDPTEIDFYSDHNEETMAPFGGRYLRLSEHPLELLEGGPLPALGVGLAEFPSMEQARGWYDSEAYAPLKAWRMARGRFTLVLLQGLSEGATLRSTALEAVEQARVQQQRVAASLGEGSTGSEPVPSPG
jgi:uncharacterized protein (DUF1330 family)